MNKISKIILSVMLVMAIFGVCFGLGDKTNFFVTMEETLTPLSNVSNKIMHIVQEYTGSYFFADDDEIEVVRLYFRYDEILGRDEGYAGSSEKQYCDLIKRKGTFSRYVLYYCTDDRVVDWTGSAEFEFINLVDKDGVVVYRHTVNMKIYVMKTTFGEYFEKFKYTNSTEGWEVH